MSFFDTFFGATSGSSVIPSGQYCVRNDLEQLYGVENIKRWADLDNTEDVTAIESRVTYACEEAYVEINSSLRTTRYKIPFETPFSRELVTLSSMFAGLWLYEARGAVDLDEMGNKVHRYAHMRQQFYKRLKAIARGSRVIEGAALVSTNSAPAVVNE